VLPVLLASPCGDAGELSPGSAGKAMVQVAQADSAKARYLHLRPEDRLGDLLDHPAFQGFSHRMLPWDGRDYDRAMPLENIGQLLPYHSQVEPAVVVSALNRMVDDASAGRSVFYDFYTVAQRQAQPSLKNTGLFFFRGRPGAPFAVIAPGGGFAYVGSVHEGFPYAEAISRQGLNAFVLKYRAGQGGRVATEDLAAAIAYIFENARALQVGTEGYSLWGSSAGARMAAAIGSHGTAAFGATPLPKPSVVVMAYTGHSEVAASEPPTFVVVGDSDGIAPPAAMEARIAALRHIGTRVEYHKYPRVGHGFGTGQGTSAQGWIDQAVRFWKKEIGRTPRMHPSHLLNAPK
jgi:acetyl esterase/lipase